MEGNIFIKAEDSVSDFVQQVSVPETAEWEGGFVLIQVHPLLCV